MLSGGRLENVEVDEVVLTNKAVLTNKTDGGEGYVDFVDDLLS